MTQVIALNCPNCGGGLQVNQAECSYCGSGIKGTEAVLLTVNSNSNCTKRELEFSWPERMFPLLFIGGLTLAVFALLNGPPLPQILY